mmetsp:Transcript_29432/g.54012  ORF Transcript_29432/g.54012 Transcript_29432/m.54012 type:complete len:432 (-) Transcript_29432:72-1367(-)|eukprot:CAMPEP_0175047636 /NCGR_PEP_ID=MMETSP0052_2-20121109/5715_1 /TAXON_ID=51329 ORGANISM="Polytomella parva, Strain SAG 63-3" /NCGR_SAMPLE_ID=MMETSP0052_2 /ASSEMBLY_ACC=CAM_ASM_000194 /LENGTH=431 /DNA_ID=CAMNT_0016311553 /DNA_START=54 /DNA_END=1346 /DNA_ORIENTATION=+
MSLKPSKYLLNLPSFLSQKPKDGCKGDQTADVSLPNSILDVESEMMSDKNCLKQWKNDVEHYGHVVFMNNTRFAQKESDVITWIERMEKKLGIRPFPSASLPIKDLSKQSSFSSTISQSSASSPQILRNESKKSSIAIYNNSCSVSVKGETMISKSNILKRKTPSNSKPSSKKPCMDVNSILNNIDAFLDSPTMSVSTTSLSIKPLSGVPLPIASSLKPSTLSNHPKTLQNSFTTQSGSTSNGVSFTRQPMWLTKKVESEIPLSKQTKPNPIEENDDLISYLISGSQSVKEESQKQEVEKSSSYYSNSSSSSNSSRNHEGKSRSIGDSNNTDYNKEYNDSQENSNAFNNNSRINNISTITSSSLGLLPSHTPSLTLPPPKPLTFQALTTKSVSELRSLLKDLKVEVSGDLLRPDMMSFIMKRQRELHSPLS